MAIISTSYILVTNYIVQLHNSEKLSYIPGRLKKMNLLLASPGSTSALVLSSSKKRIVISHRYYLHNNTIYLLLIFYFILFIYFFFFSFLPFLPIIITMFPRRFKGMN